MTVPRVHLFRRTVLAMAGTAILTSNGSSQTADPRAAIVDLYTTLQIVMRLGTATPFQQRFDRLAPIIDRDFDLDAILRTSVGLRWQTLDEASRQRLFAVFRTFTIASYAANFDKDAGERFEVLPQIRASGTDQIVQSRLITSAGEQIRMDYVMRAGPTGWRVTDVLVDGSISRVAVQRSDFRSLLASGDPAPLVDSLRRKIAELSNGAMRP